MDGKTAEVVRGFGLCLKRAREDSNVSRRALAGAVDISPKTIQSWEEGRTFPENLHALRKAEVLLGFDSGVLLSTLLGKIKVKKVELPKRRQGRRGYAGYYQG